MKSTQLDHKTGDEKSLEFDTTLTMVWTGKYPDRTLLKGYSLRIFEPKDKVNYMLLLVRSGFTTFNLRMYNNVIEQSLEDGIFLVIEDKTGMMVGTSGCMISTWRKFPDGGKLGWTATHPDHTGMGIGKFLCYTATNNFLEKGYKRDNIYLITDVSKFKAILVYFATGWIPYGNTDRWAPMLSKLEGDKVNG